MPCKLHADNDMTTPRPSMPRHLPLRLPRVCVAVVGTNPGGMIEKAETLSRENPFIEFRLDYLSTPALILPGLRKFLEYHSHVIAVATCRRAANGGKFRGTVQSEVDLLVKAASAGCQIVDLSLESAAKLKSSDIEKLRSRAGLILSYHDFRGTKNLDKIFDRMQQYPADFVKIVGTATCLYDNVVMMKFLERTSDNRSMVGVCMGEQGIISRVLGVRAGSQFTFAAATVGEETAPGQIAARTLRETYRIEQVDNATRVYGVAGDPVSHSLSPLMMNAAFRREALNAVYLSLHAKTIKDLIACARDIPLHGISVTMPYKEEIIKHLDNTDPVTAKIGACNTVIRSQDGKLYGFNTDVFGVLRPLEARIPIKDSNILVLGAGGAARAAVFGLRERGANVYVMNRTASAGQRLAKQAKAKYIGKSQLKPLMKKFQFQVVINATSVGMDDPGKPMKASKDTPLNEAELKLTGAKYLMEMVYAPAETKLMKIARAMGMEIISGAEMFVHQGARQFEIWTGKPAPTEDMHRVVVTALANRAAAAAAKK
jgi:3-dehydroquinate dehydratase / shikimate dehydrogenase